MHKAAQAYFSTQISTTSQGQLLLMLYDGAIKFLHQAKEKMRNKDYAAKGILISKAMDVISELDNSLNATKGGDLAVKMHGLYFFCNTRLLKANLDLDTGLVDEVIKILNGLRSAYAQIIPSEVAASGQEVSAAPEPPLQTAPKSPPAAAKPVAPHPPGDAPRGKAAPDAAPPSPADPLNAGQTKLRSGANAYRRMASST